MTDTAVDLYIGNHDSLMKLPIFLLPGAGVHYPDSAGPPVDD
jgi:hypothetical protein